MSFDQLNAFILDIPVYTLNGLLWLCMPWLVRLLRWSAPARLR